MRFGPSYAEICDPSSMPIERRQQAFEAATSGSDDPAALDAITWRHLEGGMDCVIVPSEMTGTETPIAVVSGHRFPSGSHKVGAAYAMIVEAQLRGELEPGQKLLVPSSGNFAIAAAWVGRRMGYEVTGALPRQASQNKKERLQKEGGQLFELQGPPRSDGKHPSPTSPRGSHRASTSSLDQFSDLANYRFHSASTSHALIQLAQTLFEEEQIGTGVVDAFVSGIGSAGTLGAGDHVKAVFPDCRLVGVEAEQAPLLFSGGSGSHALDGFGLGEVPWLLNAMNLDLLVGIDDEACWK